MSLSRLALRLAAIEALCPSRLASSGPWPTIAGGLVFDSRIDLMEGDERLAGDIEGRPVAIVYTERDDTAPYGEIRYPAQERVCHLIVEILIAAKGVIEVEGADGATATVGTIGVGATDREREGLLDLLEAQVLRLLGKWSRQDMPASAALYNEIMMEVRRIESVPERSADRSIRYAARTICLHVKMKAEYWPLDLQPGQSAPTGLDLLPAPLSTIAKGLDPTSTGYALCMTFVPLVNMPVERVQLEDIRMFAGLDGRTPQKPDGSDSDIVGDIPSP
jgi:hypothetical protein